MKCNDILNKNVKENYRRDCTEENCPYNFIPDSCIYLYTGKVKVKEMLLKIKVIVDNQYNDLNENVLDYNTELIVIMSSIDTVIKNGLKEID